MHTFEHGVYLSEMDKQPTKPTVARLRKQGNEYVFIVIGTNYGYIHTNQGNVRIWKTYSGAYKAAKNYVGL